MSTRNRTLVEGATGLIARGKSNTPTETAVEVTTRGGVITLTQTGKRPAARDVTVATKLSVAEATSLREGLAELLDDVDRGR